MASDDQTPYTIDEPEGTGTPEAAESRPTDGRGWSRVSRWGRRNDETDPAPGAGMGEGAGNGTTTAVADDETERHGRQAARGVQHVGDQRPAGERMQHFRQAGVHPLALAGGHHDELQSVRMHACEKSGGGTGCEAAMPSAIWVCWAERPSRREQAAAAPRVPVEPVMCQPRS